VKYADDLVLLAMEERCYRAWLVKRLKLYDAVEWRLTWKNI